MAFSSNSSFYFSLVPPVIRLYVKFSSVSHCQQKSCQSYRSSLRINHTSLQYKIRIKNNTISIRYINCEIKQNYLIDQIILDIHNIKTILCIYHKYSCTVCFLLYFNTYIVKKKLIVKHDHLNTYKINDIIKKII